MTTSPAAAQPCVLLERPVEHVAIVTLNRPESRNAINAATARELEAVLGQTEADAEIHVVVLTGSGNVFCAGADLKEVAAGGSAGLFTDQGGFAGFVFAQRRKPWIVAANGPALAGGAEIALAADLIVACETATFGLPEVSRGLIAAAGGLFRLPRALPGAVARELILTADAIDARQALHFGLVNRVVPKDLVLDEAIKLASRIARNAPVAVIESLRVARAADCMDDAELRALTQEARQIVANTEDYREGPRAFAEKRQPRWNGR